jgi:mersacidin/lichenicidin family type 2 lantibiotic
MKHKVDVIRAWKDRAYRASLSAEDLASLPENPAGAPLSDLEAGMIRGGQIPPDEPKMPQIPSEGWFCTVSGECNGGTCCNPFSSW